MNKKIFVSILIIGICMIIGIYISKENNTLNKGTSTLKNK